MSSASTFLTAFFNLPHTEVAENKPPLEVKVVAAAVYGAVSKNE